MKEGRDRSVARASVGWASRRLLTLLGIRLHVRGALPREPALLLANHLSWLDIVAVLAHCDCTFVAKREVRDWPIIGWLAARMGVVFVDRTRKRELLHTIPFLADTLRSGASVLLFPEGTTGTGRQLLPFKSALVQAAVDAGVPVVPVAITASASAPTDALCWIDDETLLHNLPRVQRLSQAQIELRIAPPIGTDPRRKWLTGQARNAIARRTADGAIRERVERPTRAALSTPVTAAAS